MGSTWTSLPVELLRFGGEIGILRRGDAYLVARGDAPVAKYEMELDHEELLDRLDVLRYASGASDARRRAAFEELGTLAARMLGLELPASDVQVELVVAAKELAALPFEAVIGADRKALLLRQAPAIELTRRVRGAVRDPARGWPAKPRILLAAAQPEQPVPVEDHRAALAAALAPWLAPPGPAGDAEAVPDASAVLTVLERASVASIREACREAARRKAPFTHVHLLAHGCAIGSGTRQQWGLSLHADHGEGAVAVGAEDLAEALGGAGALPTLATLTACDSGNVGSTVVAGASLAHALHCAGVPVVIGSQFPLTKAGSTVVVEELYGALLSGEDVRAAIHRTRLALHARGARARHDWMSLVAYVQLPGGYADALVAQRLEAALASLRATQRWTDDLARDPGAAPERYDHVAGQLRERIDALVACAAALDRSGRGGALDENRGLLGSAYKRLAELLWLRAARGDAPGRWRESRKALRQSRRWYGRAFAGSLSAHWVGVQQLALDAVLDGRIPLPWQWHAALAAARNACAEDPAEYWACGSRAELHLLAPYAGEPRQLGEAAAALRELAERAGTQPEEKKAFALETTRRQLGRYTGWWTAANGFFDGKGRGDLAEDVEQVLRDAGWARSRSRGPVRAKARERRVAGARAVRAGAVARPRGRRGRP